MIWRALVILPFLVPFVVAAVGTNTNTSEALRHLRDTGENALNITRDCVEVWPQCRSSVAHGVVSTAVSVANSIARGQFQRAPEKKLVELDDRDFKRELKYIMIKRVEINQQGQ